MLSAPDIDWSYAVIERQSTTDLTTRLIPFNLGKAIMDKDQSQNLELLPGDMVSIFSTADLRVPSAQQTRFVRLEGEFNGAGVYSVLPGETLRQLLVRAGGFTPDAYLYASEFTRQSTKRVQQQRLREYADQLEAQVAVETQGLAQRAVSDRDQAAAAAAGSSARMAVERLRQIEPEGRIVLQLKPDSRTVEEVPDLALEDGDRFVVPRTPSNVNVEGQVYSANAFVFERGRNVKDYLKIAGGPSRDADSKRAFVLRADGSVFSDQYGDLQKATMFPGDTIVVPMKVEQKALLRNLVDIATIVGQFGLFIAAINVLK
jgi:protein involved in polysaccharide export with SLBB domain